MTRLLDSRVAFWVIAFAWVILTPFFIGFILWHFLIMVPQEEAKVLQRQTQLLKDDAVIIRNQDVICKALKVECEARSPTDWRNPSD